MDRLYWFISGSPINPRVITKIDISHESVYGHDVLRKDGRWEKNVGGYKKQGLKVYTFEDQKAGLSVTIVMNTYEECFKFAEKCYQQLRDNQWQTITLR